MKLGLSNNLKSLIESRPSSRLDSLMEEHIRRVNEEMAKLPPLPSGYYYKVVPGEIEKRDVEYIVHYSFVPTSTDELSISFED